MSNFLLEVGGQFKHLRARGERIGTWMHMEEVKLATWGSERGSDRGQLRVLTKGLAIGNHELVIPLYGIECYLSPAILNNLWVNGVRKTVGSVSVGGLEDMCRKRKTVGKRIEAIDNKVVVWAIGRGPKGG